MSKKMLVVKVGSDNRPASEEDLKKVEDQIREAIKLPDSVLVTHHNIDFHYVSVQEE